MSGSSNLDPERLSTLHANSRAIIQARANAGVTQVELARHLGVWNTQVSNAEHVRVTDATRDRYLGAIAAIVSARGTS